MAPEWYRTTDWGPGDRREFDERLRRARLHNKPQYLRIKGIALIGTSEPQLREEGRNLLRRLLADYPDAFAMDVYVAHEVLARSLHEDGRDEEAEHHYREAIEVIERGRVMGDAELGFAEFIIDSNRRDLFAEALGALASWIGRPRGLIFDSEMFRFHRALALFSDGMGGHAEAAEAAQRALAVAERSKSRPQLPRHPGVGRVRASREELESLQRIAAASGEGTG